MIYHFSKRTERNKSFIFNICYNSKIKILYQKLLRKGREKINIHNNPNKKASHFIHGAVI